MENSISVISDICGILAFIVSLFTLGGVIKIRQKIKNVDNSNNQAARGSGNQQSITHS